MVNRFTNFKVKKLGGPLTLEFYCYHAVLAAEMKSAQVESDAIYHDLCRVTFFLYTRWTENMINLLHITHSTH